jgi:hypothetical protein
MKSGRALVKREGEEEIVAGNTCTCGSRYMDAEDFRDHMPCEGSESEQAFASGGRVERAKIVAWLRTFPLNKHAREWADAIEAGEDATPGPDVSSCVQTHVQDAPLPPGVLGPIVGRD